METKGEIEAAAKWWADQLREQPDQNNGYGLQSLILDTLSSRMKPLTEKQISDFETMLITAIDEMLFNYDTGWDYANPLRGSALRVIAVDYGPDHILRKAAGLAGINLDFRLPVKTCMRINPGYVEVGKGYASPFEVVWGNKENSAE